MIARFRYGRYIFGVATYADYEEAQTCGRYRVSPGWIIRQVRY